MTISVMPALTRLRMCQTISGRPRTFSSGLGVVSVSGRMRSPRPAANIIAFMRPASEGVADLRLAVFQQVQQLDQRTQVLVAAGRLAHVVHHGRQVVQVLRLAVAVVEAAEQAENLQVALQADVLEVLVEGIDVL